MLGFEGGGVDPIVRRAKDPSVADYQANAALALAKQHGRNPRELAKAIAGALEANGLVESADVAGPGFINIKLTADALGAAADPRWPTTRLGVPRADPAGKTVVVDYSAPNVAKEMHVGHLRSTIIGDALARAARVPRPPRHPPEPPRRLGHAVRHADRAPGRRGERVAGGRLTSPTSTSSTSRRATAVRRRPGVRRRARAQRVVRAAGRRRGDARAVAAARRRSRSTHFEAVYDRLGVTLTDDDVAARASTTPMLAGVVDELERSGSPSRRRRARVFSGLNGRDGAPLHHRAQDATAATATRTTDLAAIRYRSATLDADRLIYVVDARQAHALRDGVRHGAERAGWLGAASPEHVAVRHGARRGRQAVQDARRAARCELVDAARRGGRARARDRRREEPGASPRRRSGEIARRRRHRRRQVRRPLERPRRATTSSTGTDARVRRQHRAVPAVRARADPTRSSAARREAAHRHGGASVVGHAGRARARAAAARVRGARSRRRTRRSSRTACARTSTSWPTSSATFYESARCSRPRRMSCGASRLALVELTSRTLAQGLGLLGIRTVERM